MKLNAKVWPTSEPHAAFPKEQFNWAWIINVKLVYKHSPPTAWFESFVDSGSPYCIFHASLCKPLGIKLETGIEDTLTGVVAGAHDAPMYFHKVKLFIGSERFETMAGFSNGLKFAGILGRRGFFDNFIVTLDASGNPPTVELNRIHRT